MDILRVPVSDVREYPELDKTGITRMCGELETILNKCSYCVRQQLACPLEVFVYILLRIANEQPDLLSEKILKTETSLNSVFSLTEQLLSADNRTLRLSFDMEIFFELLQILCESAILKEKIGFTVGKFLVRFMENTELHRDDYRVHRNCASCLITLLRGSKVNKNKLSVACSDVASSLQNSTDFFFQMQCSEILFRLYTHNTTVLMQAEMDVQLRKGIMELPNDSTILLNIQAFLDRYNSESRANIMPYTVLRIEVDGAEICGHTTMYFSELLLVTLLPGDNGDNFTIPFEHIRSVKLSKDHKLGLRLNSIPAKLSSAMAVDTPKDTLNVFLTQSMLQKIRTCGIHQWIAKRKQTAPLRIQQSHTPLRIESEARAAKSVEAIASVPSISERRPNVSGASSLTASRKESRMRDGSHLDDIHRAATIKTARHREERMGELQEVSDKINQKLDDLKHLNARDRDSAETSFRDDMAKVRMAEAELKESASNCVQTLNAELEDIQALGALLKAEIDKLREKMAKASGRSEGVEEASLLRIKQLVDQNVKEMELSAANLLVASNPLHTVGEYIVQKTKYQ